MSIEYFGLGGENDGKSKWALVDCEFPEIKTPPCCTFVFSKMTEHWLGKFSYNFDRYIRMDDNTMYGMKDGKTYLLNQGEEIGGNEIVAWVLSAASENQTKDKSFIRIRINSDNKPSKVEFFTSMDEFINEDVKSVLDTDANPLALKDYNGFEQYIPRRLDNGNRMQGRVMLYRIIHSNPTTEFVLVDVEVQHKRLK